MIRFIFLMMLICLPALSHGQTTTPIGQQKYRACLNQISTSPNAAYETGITWRDEGGGLPAKHCMAMAWVDLGMMEPAARVMDEVAEDFQRGQGMTFSAMVDRDDKEVLAEIYLQTGNMWMLAEKPNEAYIALSNGLLEVDEREPIRVTLLVDRGRASGLSGDFEDALLDLERARDMAPYNGEVLLFLAGAHRELDQFEQALDIISSALTLLPDNKDVLFEMGKIHFEAGDLRGATQAWTKVADLYPETEQGLNALEYLENIRVSP